MEIIAETNNGFLVEATESELKEVLCSVTGTRPKELFIGQKIPAIDYASTIKKIQSLGNDYDFKQIFSKLKDFNNTAEELKLAVESASTIEVQ